MRSAKAPRILHDATVELATGAHARAINLSTGGIFVACNEPLDPGSHVQLKVNLRDGGTPLDVQGEVVWRGERGMALRWTSLDDVGRRRIQRLVQKQEPSSFPRRDVRVRLASLPTPMRASARDLTEQGVMLEAELPWLRLGSPVTTELSPERSYEGRVQWIGLDVTRSGAARLRIFVDLGDEPSAEPPAAALVPADDALPMRARGWRRFWAGVAIAAVAAVAALAVAIFLQQRPTPALLPTSPPEREPPPLHIPAMIAVPAEKTPPVAPTPRKRERPKRHGKIKRRAG